MNAAKNQPGSALSSVPLTAARPETLGALTDLATLPPAGKNNQKGVIAALLAFFCWSCFPFYFKLLAHFDAMEIIVHRIIWTFAGLGVFLLMRRHFHGIKFALQRPKWLAFTLVSALLIGSNWLTYVWAVTHDNLLQASLGYFLSPLVGIFLSFFVLKERLRRLQWLAVLLAAAGVLVQIVVVGALPLVSMGVALTFSVYGLMQKKTPIDGLSALFLETVLLMPFCLIWLQFSNVQSANLAFWWSKDVLPLIWAGPITLIPLLLYNYSTKKVEFSLLSFMNYITPSMVFLLAVFYYKEPINQTSLMVFALIWFGLILFTFDLLRNNKRAVNNQ